jgi:hypothetical protein
MSIVKNIIDFTAGLMGILFEKYEGAQGQAQMQSQRQGPEPEEVAEQQTAEVDDLTRAIRPIGSPKRNPSLDQDCRTETVRTVSILHSLPG